MILATHVNLSRLANVYLKLKNQFGTSQQLSEGPSNVMCMATMKFHRVTVRSQVIFALTDFSKDQKYTLVTMDSLPRF